MIETVGSWQWVGNRKRQFALDGEGYRLLNNIGDNSRAGTVDVAGNADGSDA